MIGKPLRWLAPAALVTLFGCGRCSSTPAAGTSGAVADAAAPSATAAPAASLTPPADVPEVVDLGAGRATAALRAALQAYGIPFDAATLERECEVDEDGASLADLEEVAVKYGLEAGTVIVPAEHLLLPEAKMLPAIVIVEGPDDEEELVLAWRVDGSRVQVMSPRVGRRWIPRADLENSLYVHKATLPVVEYRGVLAAPAFGDALRARMGALGVDRAAAQALLDRAAADPGWRGFAALDAAIRKLDGDGVDAGGGDAAARLGALVACAMEKKCTGVQPMEPALWSVREAPKGPDGEAQVEVEGTVMLAIVGKAAAGDAAP